MHLVLDLPSSGLGVSQSCGTSCGFPLLVETGREILVRDRTLEIISIWIVTKAVRVDEIEIE